MGNPWTSPAEYAYLSGLADEYLKTCATKTYHKFWPSTFKGFFEISPITRRVAPDVDPNLEGESLAAVQAVMKQTQDVFNAKYATALRSKREVSERYIYINEQL
jgi:hypothetical protein